MKRPVRAKAITLPPAPENMSIRVVFSGEVKAARSVATLLWDVSDLIMCVGERGKVLCDWLRGYTEPGVFCHHDSLVVS